MGRVGQDRAGKRWIEKGKGNAKCNGGHSALQEEAKGLTDCARGGEQGRADYK